MFLSANSTSGFKWIESRRNAQSKYFITMSTSNTEQVECILSSCFDSAGPLLHFSVSYLIVIAEIRNSTSGYVVRAFSSLLDRTLNNCAVFLTG